MTLLEIVNRVISTTNCGVTISTVAGLDPDSDEWKVYSFVRDAQLDVSRDVPNAPLFFHGSISTVDDISVDDMTVTNGATSMTVTGAASTWIGRILYITGDEQMYRVINVSGTTVYFGDINGNALAYQGTTKTATAQVRIAQDRYLLPTNFKRPITFNDFFTGSRLSFERPEDFDNIKFDVNGGGFYVGTPERYTIYSTDTSTTPGVVRYYIEFDPIPDDVRHYPFRYEGSPTLMEADGDISGYTPEYEQAIIFRTRYYIYRFIKMNMDQANIELAEYRKATTDQQKSDVAGNAVVYVKPMTYRDHFSGAYD